MRSPLDAAPPPQRADVVVVAATIEAPTSSDDALRLAIKLAVDAGEYGLAAELLDVARRTPKAASVTPISAVRERR